MANNEFADRAVQVAASEIETYLINASAIIKTRNVLAMKC